MSKTNKQTNDALCHAAVKCQQSFGVVPKQKKMNVKGDFRFLWTMKLSRLWTDLCRIVWRSIGANKIKGSVYSTIRQDHGCIRSEYWLLSLWQRGHWGSYLFIYLFIFMHGRALTRWFNILDLQFSFPHCFRFRPCAVRARQLHSSIENDEMWTLTAGRQESIHFN